MSRLDKARSCERNVGNQRSSAHLLGLSNNLPEVYNIMLQQSNYPGHSTFHWALTALYGSHVRRDLNKLTSQIWNLARTEAGLEYLLQCRRWGVYPKFISKSIRIMRRGDHLDRLIRRLPARFLRAAICDVRRRRSQLWSSLDQLWSQLYEALNDIRQWNHLVILKDHLYFASINFTTLRLRRKFSALFVTPPDSDYYIGQPDFSPTLRPLQNRLILTTGTSDAANGRPPAEPIQALQRSVATHLDPVPTNDIDIQGSQLSDVSEYFSGLSEPDFLDQGFLHFDSDCSSNERRHSDPMDRSIDADADFVVSIEQATLERSLVLGDPIELEPLVHTPLVLDDLPLANLLIAIPLPAPEDDHLKCTRSGTERCETMWPGHKSQRQTSDGFTGGASQSGFEIPCVSKSHS